MPVNVIPKKIHFIWARNALPIQFGDNIIEWLSLNTEYEVNFWTAPHLLDAAVDTLALAYRRIMPISFQSEIAVGGTEQEKVLYLKSEALPTFRMCVNSVYALQASSKLSSCYRTAIDRHNHELLRYWVLYERGGIYFDVHIRHGGESLHEAIVAPLGLLTADLLVDGDVTICTSILACARENKKMKELGEKRESEIDIGAFRSEQYLFMKWVEPDDNTYERLWSVEEFYRTLLGKEILPRQPYATPFGFDLEYMPWTVMDQMKAREEEERARELKPLAEGVGTMLSFKVQGHPLVKFPSEKVVIERA